MTANENIRHHLAMQFQFKPLAITLSEFIVTFPSATHTHNQTIFNKAVFVISSKLLPASCLHGMMLTHANLQLQASNKATVI